MEEHNQGAATLLVVEDEMPLQDAITQKLQRSGFTSVGVRSVEDAVSALENDDTIRAVWLDHYLLGKKDGLDLVERLKGNQSSFKHVPIFVVSNTASDDKVQQYLKLGITEYYVKATNKLDHIIDDIRQALKAK